MTRGLFGAFTYWAVRSVRLADKREALDLNLPSSQLSQEFELRSAKRRRL
jgi:hypothetical protein